MIILKGSVPFLILRLRTRRVRITRTFKQFNTTRRIRTPWKVTRPPTRFGTRRTCVTYKGFLKRRRFIRSFTSFFNLMCFFPILNVEKGLCLMNSTRNYFPVRTSATGKFFATRVSMGPFIINTSDYPTNIVLAINGVEQLTIVNK